MLAKHGFLYDASIIEPYPSLTSPNSSARLWPYTMDYGIPQVRHGTSRSIICRTIAVPHWHCHGQQRALGAA